MREIVVIAHNLRSTHNVGSLFRTAEGLGVEKIYLSGYTPYPLAKDDQRLPHLAHKIGRQIHKTALGAETMVAWEQIPDIISLVASLKSAGFIVVALEQDQQAIQLPDFKPSEKLALVLGREVEGIEENVLAACDQIIEIPMLGHKESFNVVQAAAMALYHCRLLTQ
ncbi:MAG TPA: TrmH family RNA methyltransferase [Candidatus Saccharimonadales bacterium]|nr:TrmH family RNA methyltransferase [Candidatus Saccharimonadales bacterium]